MTVEKATQTDTVESDDASLLADVSEGISLVIEGQPDPTDVEEPTTEESPTPSETPDETPDPPEKAEEDKSDTDPWSQFETNPDLSEAARWGKTKFQGDLGKLIKSAFQGEQFIGQQGEKISELNRRLQSLEEQRQPAKSQPDTTERENRLKQLQYTKYYMEKRGLSREEAELEAEAALLQEAAKEKSNTNGNDSEVLKEINELKSRLDGADMWTKVVNESALRSVNLKSEEVQKNFQALLVNKTPEAQLFLVQNPDLLFDAYEARYGKSKASTKDVMDQHKKSLDVSTARRSAPARDDGSKPVPKYSAEVMDQWRGDFGIDARERGLYPATPEGLAQFAADYEKIATKSRGGR